MNTGAWVNKAIEREKLRKMLQQAAEDMPELEEVIGYDYEWEEYCTEIREIEAAMGETGIAS